MHDFVNAPKRWVKRSDALQVPCPECNAAPGAACAHDPIKIPAHLARHEAAIERGFPIKQQERP